MASSTWPVSYTCASGSFWSGRTCMSSPSTATRCPCLGSAVSGPYEPLLLPPCRAARRLLPAGSCAQRWTWWRERGAAWAGQPCSWGNLSWRQVRREQEKGGERAGETTERRGEEGWQQGRAEAAVTWKRRAKRESEAWKVQILWRIHITYCCHIWSDLDYDACTTTHSVIWTSFLFHTLLPWSNLKDKPLATMTSYQYSAFPKV